MLVSIVILTYCRPESVLELLSQLTVLDDDRLEIIVVDNGSGPETAESIREAYPQINLVVLAENKGVGSRNRGLEIAQGEIIVTLDDDMVDLDAEALTHLRRRFGEDKKLGAVNFKVVWPGTDRVRDWVHHRSVNHCDMSFSTYEITEGAVVWRRSALQQVGFYREDFFISHEGIDLAFRLLNDGWNVEYDGAVTVGHVHADGGRTPWRRYYYDTRNMFAVVALHMPLGYAVPYLFVGVGAMFVYSLRDFHLWAFLRGVAHGFGLIFSLRGERKVWNAHTAAVVAEADSWRPGFWKMVIRRLRQKEFSLE